MVLPTLNSGVPIGVELNNGVELVRKNKKEFKMETVLLGQISKFTANELSSFAGRAITQEEHCRLPKRDQFIGNPAQGCDDQVTTSYSYYSSWKS